MSQDNLVGRTVAGYKLLSHVGEGGTATVYRAEHPERGSAAIKILRPRMAQDPVAVKRFLREAEFGGRINHQYIIGPTTTARPRASTTWLSSGPRASRWARF
jgi:serine/threonine-protein kinase